MEPEGIKPLFCSIIARNCIFLKKIVSYLLDECRAPERSRLFRQLIYILVLMQCFAWALQFDLLFGEHSVVVLARQPVSALHRPAFLLFRFSSPVASALALGLTALLSVVLLLTQGMLRKLSSFGLHLLLWLLVVNLHNRIYPALTGGHFLLNQYLFFQAFLMPGRPSSATSRQTVKYLFHNLAVIAIMLQLAFVYLLSAWAKLLDPMWLNGPAFNIISQIHHYAIVDVPPSLGAVGVAFNYLVIAYQLLFPFSLLFPRMLKILFFSAGLLMHALIALVMGLGGFGLVMMIGYVFFWPLPQTDLTPKRDKT